MSLSAAAATLIFFAGITGQEVELQPAPNAQEFQPNQTSVQIFQAPPKVRYHKPAPKYSSKPLRSKLSQNRAQGSKKNHSRL